MKNKFRSLFVFSLLTGILLLISGCSFKSEEYRKNDEAGYRISVRYDANGGTFADNVEIMSDFFNPSQLKTDENGNYVIPLLSSDNELRKEPFTPKLSGHFLVGWYAERVETSEGYTYSKKWDFDKDRVTVPVDGDYTASEPVMTLYAVWAPHISVEIYDIADDSLLKTIFFNPNLPDDDIKVPQWDVKKGTVKMHDFPEKEGYTFNAAYYDKEGTKPITTETVQHASVLDESTGKVENPVTKIYVDYWEGEWFRIHDAKSFRNNLSLSANYVIMDDLDFEKTVWPSTLMQGAYKGTIIGNGHTIKNVNATQVGNSKMRNGLFGELTDEAKVSDLHFENVTFTIKDGTRVEGAYFGLFAGFISDKAELTGLSLGEGKIVIGPDIYYTENSSYIIGLVCASGNVDAITYDSITVEADTEIFDVTIEGNQVSISKKGI